MRQLGDVCISTYSATSDNSVYFDDVNVTFTAAPEPGTAKIALAGLLAAAGYCLAETSLHDRCQVKRHGLLSCFREYPFHRLPLPWETRTTTNALSFDGNYHGHEAVLSG